MESALQKLRKWESEIQFMNMVRQIHEHGNSYRKLHGESSFQELLAKIPDDHVRHGDLLVLLMMTLMLLSMMVGIIGTVVYLVA
jgi:hypothetical protein